MSKLTTDTTYEQAANLVTANAVLGDSERRPADCKKLQKAVDNLNRVKAMYSKKWQSATSLTATINTDKVFAKGIKQAQQLKATGKLDKVEPIEVPSWVTSNPLKKKPTAILRKRSGETKIIR